MAVNQELRAYIEAEIFPRYERYYSHGITHIKKVIEKSLMLAGYYSLDENMAFTMAAFHDIGLKVNRERHEYESGKILASDEELKKYFDAGQIDMMREAVEDHRGSRKEPPRNMYGKILSDADRDFDVETLARRQFAVSLKNYPNLTTFEEHFERCYKYILERNKRGEGSINLWTNNPILVAERAKFEADYLNKDYTRSVYWKEWERINADGTKEKILNYYEDF